MIRRMRLRRLVKRLLITMQFRRLHLTLEVLREASRG